MTTEPAGREDLAGLLERLKQTETKRAYIGPYREYQVYINRDGTEAHAAIIKLEQERDAAFEQEQFWQQGCNRLETKNLLLEQENAKLRGALKPFAEKAKIYTTDNEIPDGLYFKHAFKVGDLRHAAEALRADVNAITIQMRLRRTP